MAKRKSYIQRENDSYWIENGIDMTRRKIMLDEEVDEGIIGWIIRAIDVMTTTDADKPIEVTISSYGGSIYDGLALYDALESAPCPITTKATGKVMSMGLVIYLVGDTRIATARATFMAHTASSSADGKLPDLRTEVAEVSRLEELTLQIMQEKTKKDARWWKKELEYKDRFYNVDQAIELGIINETKED
jgi:ATP-dependent Clp protease protease subunit